MKKLSPKSIVFVMGAVFLLALGSYAGAQGNGQPEDAERMLSDDACRQLSVYQPDQDGSADYKPGVDVTGKPVVEADIGGAALPVPEVIEFQLTADVAQYLDLPATPRPEGYLALGTISILPDGRVLRDGAPLETQAEAALRALCE